MSELYKCKCGQVITAEVFNLKVICELCGSEFELDKPWSPYTHRTHNGPMQPIF
jgi:hypothetical protein